MMGKRIIRMEETMNPKIVIRNETHDDICAITEVTIAAFKTYICTRR
jgi:hypothetical protein